METEEKQRVRRRQRRRQPEKKNADAVVHMPPDKLEKGKLLMRLLTTLAVVVALLTGVSLFFRVSTVTVSGNGKYTQWDIASASGISEGDSLLTLNRSKAAGKIMASLPYVESVRIGINLPNTVKIEIVETEVTYAAKAEGGGWWLLSAAGRIVAQAGSGEEASVTKLLGVTLSDPVEGEQATAYQPASSETDEEGNVIPITVTAQEDLQTLLGIATYLEEYGILGSMVSMDISDRTEIVLWYGTQFEVLLGDDSQLETKIAYLASALEQMKSYQSGTLDIRFVTWPDSVGYTPFD